MKKIFTLCAAVFAAMSVNAQITGTESYQPWEGDSHTLKAEWAKNEDVTQASVANFSTENVVGVGVSGPIAEYENGSTLPLAQKNDNAWGAGNNCGDAGIFCVNGKGNPVTGVAFVEIRTDGVGTGTYRRCYDRSIDPEGPYYAADGVTVLDPESVNFYYQPDGSAGVPSNGVYYTFTPKVDGKMSIIAWVNKGGGGRKAFIAKKSDCKALVPGEEVTYSGYVNDGKCKDENGKLTYQESIDVNPENPYSPQSIINANAAAWIYLTFDAKAGETYYAFSDSSQLGLGGYEFTATSAINNISAAPVKAVAKTIQNGRVVIVKGNNTFNVAGQLVK